MEHILVVKTLRPKFAYRDESYPQVNGVGLLVREGFGGKFYFGGKSFAIS